MTEGVNQLSPFEAHLCTLTTTQTCSLIGSNCNHLANSINQWTSLTVQKLCMLSQNQDKLKQAKQLVNSQLKSWKVRCPTLLVNWPTLPAKVEEEALQLLSHECVRKQNLPKAP